MAKLNNLNSNKVQERKRQVRTYGTKTDLASTTTERGNTHWTDGSNVNIDGFLGVAGTMTVSGSLSVTGTATVSGTLSVTGTFNGSGTNNLDGTNNLSGDNNLTGPTEISGSLDVTGPTTIDGVLTINGDTSITGLLEVTGDTTISGTLDIEGNTTVTGTLDIQGRTTIKNDLELLAGGIFKAGVTKIEPNGKATFGSFIIDPASNFPIQSPGGRMVSNGSNQIGLDTPGASVLLDSFSSTIVHGSTVLSLSNGVASLLGSLKISSTPTGATPDLTPLGIDANGFVRRIA